jgi:N-acetylglucosaminyldiphosphoundecaprenol N-acetyl-beta-D-mannosaminyltransferase
MPPDSKRPARSAAGQVHLAGLGFDGLTEAEVVQHIIEESRLGRGGWVVTPNIDICRSAHRDEGIRHLLNSASLVVPDGMPVVWASRLRGDPLPERVTGSSLIFSLSAAAADNHRSIYLLGGEPGVPEQAAENLGRRYPGLVVAGFDAPPRGFEKQNHCLETVRGRLAAANPDIVYVGLGFPRQEHLITQLIPSLMNTWFVACGAAIPFAADAFRRAPSWMQDSGLEWMFRLINEPRRLLRRYLVDDLPFAARLLGSTACRAMATTVTSYIRVGSGAGRPPAGSP